MAVFGRLDTMCQSTVNDRGSGRSQGYPSQEPGKQLQQLPGHGDRTRPGQDVPPGVGVRFRLGAGNQDQPQSENGWAGSWGWNWAWQNHGCAELPMAALVPGLE